MADSSLITTIIPTYRRPYMVSRAIQSVLSQTYPHFVVHVYDNASGDETAKVVAELAAQDTRVVYFCHKENIGAVFNFQFGLQRIKTPYFSILSDDDVLLPNFYEVALRGFTQYPEVGFSAGSAIQMTEQGKVFHVPLDYWPREGLYQSSERMLYMLNDQLPQWCAVLFRKEVLDTLGGLDLEVGPPFDYDFLLRAAAQFPFALSKEPCALFIVHPQSSSSVGGLSFAWPGWLKIIQNVKSQKNLSASLKGKIEQKLRKELREVLIGNLGKSLKSCHFEEFNQTASILKTEFNLVIFSYFVRFMGSICRRIPLLNKGVAKGLPWIRLLWRWIMRKNLRKRQNQKAYGYLSQWL